jgi:hypothetical protein
MKPKGLTSILKKNMIDSTFVIEPEYAQFLPKIIGNPISDKVKKNKKIKPDVGSKILNHLITSLLYEIFSRISMEIFFFNDSDKEIEIRIIGI